MTQTVVSGPFQFEGVRQSGDQAAWTGTLTIRADLPFLQGHFPGTPIVPAMAILEASRAFVALVGGEPARTVTGARHCKFRQPIGAEETYDLTATAARPGVWQVAWTAAGGGEPVVEVELTTRGLDH